MGVASVSLAIEKACEFPRDLCLFVFSVLFWCRDRDRERARMRERRESLHGISRLWGVRLGALSGSWVGSRIACNGRSKNSSCRLASWVIECNAHLQNWGARQIFLKQAFKC